MEGMEDGVPAPQVQTKYAGFWLRVCAALIDGTLLSIPVVSVGFLLGYHDPPGADALLLFVQLFNFVFVWFYNAVLESSAWQATIGKHLLGLRVTDVHGHQISFGRATGRYFGEFVSALIFGLGYVMAGLTDRKQALHDILAGCLVLRAQAPDPPPAIGGVP